MKYSEFEAIFSADRTHRYLQATSNDKRKAMTLYRWNLHLAQEMFAVINCFEVALRNAIDRHMTHYPDTSYVLNKYAQLQALFSWLGIDSQSLLYGLDHVHSVCGRINGLK